MRRPRHRQRWLQSPLTPGPDTACGSIAARYNTRLPSDYAIALLTRCPQTISPMPPYPQSERKPASTRRVVKKDPIMVDGVRPRPMFVDYKDLDLLSKLVNRHGRIVSRRKTGCHAASQHAVAKAIKRARFMALMPYIGG